MILLINNVKARDPVGSKKHEFAHCVLEDCVNVWF